MPNHILPTALKLPIIKKLEGKRIVLASNSPRRQEILRTYGLAPDIVPSEFEENLAPSSFSDVHEYPVATATHKAVEVYERLVSEDPDNPPDLVIAVLPSHSQELLEKPVSKEDNLRMLLDINGGVCEVVTGVVVDNPRHVVEAYVENGEGLDRAGGFAIQ
ncbi:hypothetical protein C0993_011406, partial [Termitomyces sp. T159_Od127]